MDYKEIKAAVDSKRQEIDSLKALLARDVTAINNLNRDLTMINAQKQEELNHDKALQLKKKQDDVTANLRKDISDLENKRVKAQQRKNEDLNSIDIEDYKRAYANETSSIDSILNATSDVEESSRKFLGDRLYDSVIANLGNNKLATDDLDVIVDRANRLKFKFNNIDIAKILDWGDFIEKIFNKINPEKFENKNSILAYTLVIVVVLFFTSKLLFPVLLFLFLILGGFNIYRSKGILQSMQIAKSISDNRQAIMDSINNEIQNHMAEDRKYYEDEYKKIDDKLVKDINEKESEIQRLLQDVAFDFKYDSTEVDKRYNAKRSNIESQLSSVNKDKESHNTLISKANIELNALLEDLKSSMENIVDCYTSMDYKKEEFVFDPEFLIDVIDTQPVMYKHPMGSILYKYNNLSDCNNFIKLMMIESIVRMNMRCYSPVLLDSSYMCSVFRIMYSDTWKGYIQMATSIKQIQETISDLSISLNERFAKFGGDTIDKYNAEKIRTGSVPFSYIWAFIIEPDQSILDSEEMKQLMLNGYKVGIIINIFMSEDNIKEQSNRLLPVLSNLQYYGVITKNGILNRPKDGLKMFCSKK